MARVPRPADVFATTDLLRRDDDVALFAVAGGWAGHMDVGQFLTENAACRQRPA